LLCQRTATCSLELAREGSGPADAIMNEALERDQPKLDAACRASCGADADDGRTEFQRERARVCLGKSSCAELETSMAAL